MIRRLAVSAFIVLSLAPRPQSTSEAIETIVEPPPQATESVTERNELPVIDNLSKTEVYDQIVKLSVEYGVNTETALRIAFCESGYNQFADNPHSSALGVYQWTIGTWEYIGEKQERTDAEANIRAFMLWYPKYPNWWVCK